MKNLVLLIGVGFTTLLQCEATYKPVHHKNMPTYTPTTLEEVKKYLCAKVENNQCSDHAPATIIINKLFDFTASEGMKQEVGCFHSSSPAECRIKGQLKLNVVNQCNGLVPTNVTFGVAGRCGIDVGSNKIVIGVNGGGFKGKGLRLRKSHNVEIRNLTIIDINAQTIWGGDGIDLIGVKNVLIDGNYIKNIGRQMIVTHFGKNIAVMISNNVFDGRTSFSATCDGAHYWLWLFLGEGDYITLQNNVILNTSGRGPHLVASKDGKTLLHMIQNTFYDIKDTGLIDLDDPRSSILVEGNVFVNVKEIVHANKGNIFMPQNAADQKACEVPLGRQCLLNTVVNSKGDKPKNSLQTLEDFKKASHYLAKPIDMKSCVTKLIDLPSSVKVALKV